MALQVKDMQKIDGRIHTDSIKNLLTLPLYLKIKKKLSNESYGFLMHKINRLHKYFREPYKLLYRYNRKKTPQDLEGFSVRVSKDCEWEVGL